MSRGFGWLCLGFEHKSGRQGIIGFMLTVLSLCVRLSDLSIFLLQIWFQALFAAGVILLAEKLLVRFIAIRFHRKALAVCNNFQTSTDILTSPQGPPVGKSTCIACFGQASRRSFTVP